MKNYCWLRGFVYCVLSLLLLACSSKVELLGGIPEVEANEVLAALQNAGIASEKTPGKEGMVGVSIPAEEVGRAVDMLRAKGLPRERFAGMGQVFKKEGLISSPLEERARYLYALSQELGSTLSQIDGVLVARVHVVLPERGAAGDPNMPSSAAIFIKYQDGYNLDTVLPQVRRLVTNSIPGLTTDKVSIVLVGAEPSAPNVKSRASVNTETLSPGVPIPIFLAIALLLLASVCLCAFLAWKFWWPNRAQNKAMSAKDPI
jgi:type III secretion protein J